MDLLLQFNYRGRLHIEVIKASRMVMDGAPASCTHMSYTVSVYDVCIIGYNRAVGSSYTTKSQLRIFKGFFLQVEMTL